MLRALVLVAALVWMAAAPAAEPAFGTLGILEGDALVFRGMGRLHAAEGMKLEPGDIVQTAANTFMQVELGGDAVVQLGPTTNAMFQRGTTRGKTDQWVYVMDGWVKARGAQDGRIAADIRTPAVEVPGSPSTVVMRTSPAEVTLFVERGQVRLLERAAPKGGKADRGDPTAGATPVALNAGQLYQRKGGNARTVSTGGLAAFVQEMPRSFRDSLPMRSERFAGKDIKLREAPDPTYADLQAWLQAEPAVRKPMVKRFRAKVKEEPFRAALAANMRAHMEWDPILFPEKYLPKPASAPDAASAATAQRWRTP